MHRTAVGMMGLALGLATAGCGETTSPMCVGESSVAEVDDDLGGISAELHAEQRTALLPMLDADGHVGALELRTVAVGPVAVERGTDCSDNVAYVTDVEVSLRSTDGRVDLELDGELAFDGIFGGGLTLEVDPPSLASLPGRLDLPQRIGATDRIVGVVFELSGFDGEGEIEWVMSNGTRITAARLMTPWAAVEPTI